MIDRIEDNVGFHGPTKTTRDFLDSRLTAWDYFLDGRGQRGTLWTSGWQRGITSWTDEDNVGFSGPAVDGVGIPGLEINDVGLSLPKIGSDGLCEEQ